MKKYTVGVAILAMLSFGVAPAQASVAPTIAIIDSGFDVNQIGQNVVQEVCVLATGYCSNGQTTQVGPGASGSIYPISPAYASDWQHGTDMASSVLSVNQNANLLLIKNSKVYSNGSVWFGNELDLVAALNWVIANKDTYNIVGVSMSRGSHNYVLNDAQARKNLINTKIYSDSLQRMGTEAKYSASIKKYAKMLGDTRNALAGFASKACPASASLSSAVTQLMNSNVATFFATGNDYDHKYVDAPACIDDAIAVTASDGSKIINFANVASNTDFAYVAPNTSTATAKLAGKWSLLYNGNYQQTYISLRNHGELLDKYAVVGVN